MFALRPLKVDSFSFFLIQIQNLAKQLANLNGEIILGKVKIMNGIILTVQEADVFIDKIHQRDQIKNELEKTLATQADGYGLGIPS